MNGPIPARRLPRRILASLVLALVGQGVGAAEPAASSKKFIELGWDIPSTALLRESWRAMEQTTPFDGVMFKVEARSDDGRTISSEAVWDARPWKRAWVQGALADLQSCRFARFTDNFVRFNATPGNLDWADETGWAALAAKAGLCAWLMKQAGSRGLAIDFESYGTPQFRFDAGKGRPFADTAALARQRGAQFVQAIAGEFPDAVLLTLFMNSINLRAGASDTPDPILASSGYGLLPAFIDGMLDAAPPTLVLVDGCENGYYLDSAEEYLRAAHEMRSWNGGAIRLVSPSNRPKYRRQVQAGFGFYLDMFLNDATNRYYRGPLDGSRLQHLVRNLAFARDASDHYVWIYGEQCRWWGRPLKVPNSVGRGRLWEEAMPGLTRAVAYVRDPLRAARDDIERFRAAGTLTNLARNAGFARPARAGDGALPAEFSAWQDEKTSSGRFAWDAAVDAAASLGGDQPGEAPGSARATGVKWGCFLQSRPVNPGETYAVRALCRSRGASTPTLVVRWQTAEDRWTHEPDDRTFGFQRRQLPPPATDERSVPRTDEWQEAFGVVTVPPDVGKLVILLNVTGQSTTADACWFDDLALFRLR